MQTVATVAACCMCDDHDCEPCKMAEPIEVPFGIWSVMGEMNQVLDVNQYPPWKGQFWRTYLDMPAGVYSQ